MRKPATGRPVASGDVASPITSGTAGPSWSPWRTVVGFGVVSLAADMVYEGARSVTGPLLASLGASAVLVGLVSGAGEAMALLLRVVSGSWADRSGRYWTLTFAGYALTAICVPALAITPFLAGAGLAVACILILGERFGKAVRSPAKTALLAHAAAEVGLGRGFGVHKALDQIGAVAGPLLVAAVLAAAGSIWPAMAVLIVPGAVAMLVLVRIRRSMGDPVERQTRRPSSGRPPGPDRRESLLSTVAWPAARVFWLFAAASAAITGGLVTFAIIAYHLTQDHVVPVAAVPLIYAAAMGAAALAALGSGWLFDRTRGRCLVGPAASGVRRARSGVRRLAADRHRRCAALGRGWRSTGLHGQGAGGRPRPGPETRHRVRRLRRCSGRRRYRRWSHGRRTVRAIAPHADCGRRSHARSSPLYLLIATLRRINEFELRQARAFGDSDLFQSSVRSRSSR